MTPLLIVRQANHETREEQLKRCAKRWSNDPFPKCRDSEFFPECSEEVEYLKKYLKRKVSCVSNFGNRILYTIRHSPFNPAL